MGWDRWRCAWVICFVNQVRNLFVVKQTAAEIPVDHLPVRKQFTPPDLQFAHTVFVTEVLSSSENYFSSILHHLTTHLLETNFY